MIKLNPFAISGLLITITYLPLFLFILIKGKTRLTKVYSFHIFSVLWWGVFSFIIPSFQEIQSAEFVWRASNVGVYFISTFFLHAVFILTNSQNKFLIWYSYLQSIIFILLVLCGFSFSGIFYFQNSYFVPKANIIHFFGFINWALICSIAHITLIKYYVTNFREEKNQITLLYISIIGFLGGSSNFLPTFGFNVYPFGNFLVPLHSLVVTYAILKYQFLNIQLAFRKGISYSILLIVVLIFYALTVLIFEKHLQEYFGYKSIGISIITAFVIGILIIPVHNKIQSFIDKLFLARNPQDLAEENELLRQEILNTDKLKTISTFASGIAHEIKNPLTSIKIFCEYLPKKINDKEFINNFIPLITRDADRINELIHDLLDYAKPSTPELKSTDIHKLIDSVLDALSAQIVSRKIEVFKDFDQRIKTIQIDSKQIKQAFLNILLNAVESIPSTGSLLITTQLHPKGKKMSLKITDSGYGISPEDLPRIFDPFFTKKEKGTGLGLSITHGIIKEHGGKIFVKSILDQGTTFRIELPLRNN